MSNLRQSPQHEDHGLQFDSAWRQHLALGIPELDEQHRDILDCVGMIGAIISHPRREMEEYLHLERLQNALSVHFSVEEIVMRLFDYPDMDEHITAHRTLMEYTVLFQRAALQDRPPRVAKFLENSLVEHFSTSDRRYAEFILGAKASPAKKRGEARRPQRGSAV
jgi:hemerythrin